MVFLTFPNTLTEEEEMLKQKYAKLRKKVSMKFILFSRLKSFAVCNSFGKNVNKRGRPILDTRIGLPMKKKYRIFNNDNSRIQ